MNPTSVPPVVSVLIPVLNGARYLGEAVTSVLEQGVAELEVIILVDDRSEDESGRVAESFVTTDPPGLGRPVVRCVRHGPAGLAVARNEAASMARGRFLIHLDSDDLLTPGSIAVRLAAMSADPQADMVTGTAVAFVSPEIPPEQANRYDLPKAPQAGGLPGTSLVRASFAARIGPQDPSLPHSGDLDWMIRARESGGRLLVLPDVVLRRRIHGRNTSLVSRGTASRLKILRSALERRARTAGPSQP